jgi:predicted acetyltransferase
MNVKKQVKELWKLCFNEEEAFVDMYFDLRYSSDKNIYIQSDDKIISALQMITYPMTFCGTKIRTSYISGACTHPDYRRKGTMYELLSQAFVRMQSTGILFSTLIPARPQLIDYYARLGYVSMFEYSKHIFRLAEMSASANIKVEYTTEYQDDIYNYFNKKNIERTCCIQHTKVDFKIVLADLFLAGGKVFFAGGEEQSIEGIALASAVGNTLYVKELFSENPETENELLRQAAIMYGCTEIIVVMPPTTEIPERFPLGMVRIIDAEKMLRIFAAVHPEVEITIELHDHVLSSNNGYYCLLNGRCIKGEMNMQKTFVRLSVGELAERVFTGMQPYMGLMVN